MGKVYRECEKRDKCRHGRNCPYDDYPLTGFLCFEIKKYKRGRKNDTKRTMTTERIQALSDQGITAQIHIALNDYCGSRNAVMELSQVTGIAAVTIDKYLMGAFPTTLNRVEKLLEAAGYKLEVTPISSDDRKEE